MLMDNLNTKTYVGCRNTLISRDTGTQVSACRDDNSAPSPKSRMLRHRRTILVKSAQIRLYLPFYDWSGTKPDPVWCQINRKMQNTIWFRLIGPESEVYFSVCDQRRKEIFFQKLLKLVIVILVNWHISPRHSCICLK